jgi:hypothetical protein
MTALLCTLAGLCLLTAFENWLAGRAPEGWEDPKTGFHRGKKG